MERFDAAEIKRHAEENIRRRIYIHGRDEILDDVAMNIFSSFEWIMHSMEPSRENTLLIREELRTKYSGMKTVKEMLSYLVEKQAEIMWYFKGCRQNQPEWERKNDYYDAKRYIAFLLADKLLRKCNEKKMCPEQSLQQDYIEYLQCITVDEFARYKAYLRWNDRNKNNRVKDNDKHLEDYFTAIAFLDKTVINCKNRQCSDSIEYWRKIIESNNYPTKLDIIKRAKINTLRRLFHDDQEKIDYVTLFVTDFYNNIEQLLSRKVTSDKTIEEIVDSLYKNSDVINMFEFILKCFLVSRLTREEHNQIRTKNNKPSI